MKFISTLFALVLFSATAHAMPDNMDLLLDLSNNADPAIRAEAATSLRDYAGNHRANKRLMELASDGIEGEAVRKEAIKSLGTGFSNPTVSRALELVAQDKKAPMSLRVLAVKSLYTTAGSDTNMRTKMLNTLKDKRLADEIRQAAAWGVFSTLGASQVAEDVLKIAQDKTEALALRVEVVKSLYHASNGSNNYSVVRRGLMKLVADGGEVIDVRVAATRALQGVNGDSDVKRLLNDAAYDVRAPEVQVAAVKALKQTLTEDSIRYFHLRDYPKTARDALEFE